MMIVSSRNNLAVPHILIQMCNALGFFFEHGWSIHRTLCHFCTYHKNHYEI